LDEAGLEATRRKFILTPEAGEESPLVDVELRFDDVGAAQRQFCKDHSIPDQSSETNGRVAQTLVFAMEDFIRGRSDKRRD
jgi:hypothetical protein